MISKQNRSTPLHRIIFSQLPLMIVSSVSILASCIIPLGNGDTGDVLISWTFQGESLCDAVGVSNVNVQMAPQDGSQTFGVQVECVRGSAVLETVTVGSYDVYLTATGEDASFYGRGEVIVEANQLNKPDTIDLQRGDAIGTSLQFAWKFMNDKTCAEAQVDAINVQVKDIDGIPLNGINVPCNNGALLLEGLASGEVSVLVEGVRGALITHTYSETVILNPGYNALNNVITLQPRLGELEVAWTFPENTSCTDAQVELVRIELLAEDNVVEVREVPCALAPQLFVDLPPRQYSARVFANSLFLAEFAGNDTGRVSEGETGRITVPLEITNAWLRVVWNFQDPNDPVLVSSDCVQGNVDVDTLTVQVFDLAGRLIQGVTAECLDGEANVADLPAGAYRIVVDAFDNDTRIFSEQSITGSFRGVPATLDIGMTSVAVTLEPVVPN